MSLYSKKIKEDLLKDFGISLEPWKIINFDGDINWKYVFRSCKFSIDHIVKYQNCFNKDRTYWVLFTMYQDISSEEIYDLFGDSIFSEYGLWDNISASQVLPERVISKYFDYFEFKSALVETQRLSTELLERLINYYSSVEADSTEFSELYESIIYCQLLELDFIKSHYLEFSDSDILSYQRVTPRLINELGLGEKSGLENYVKYNYLYRTDIGKDWFIGYVEEKISETGTKLYSPFLLKTIDPSSYIIYDIEKIKKARIYYNDIVTLRKFRKVDILRSYTKEEVDINFYKR